MVLQTGFKESIMQKAPASLLIINFTAQQVVSLIFGGRSYRHTDHRHCGTAGVHLLLCGQGAAGCSATIHW